MDENVNQFPVLETPPPPVVDSARPRKFFQLVKDSWKGFSKKERIQLIAVFTLVLGLPTLMGGLYTVKFLNSRAVTPPITPPDTPSPIPTSTPKPTWRPRPTWTSYPSTKPTFTPRPTWTSYPSTKPTRRPVPTSIQQ